MVLVDLHDDDLGSKVDQLRAHMHALERHGGPAGQKSRLDLQTERKKGKKKKRMNKLKRRKEKDRDLLHLGQGIRDIQNVVESDRSVLVHGSLQTGMVCQALRRAGRRAMRGGRAGKAGGHWRALVVRQCKLHQVLQPLLAGAVDDIPGQNRGLKGSKG